MKKFLVLALISGLIFPLFALAEDGGIKFRNLEWGSHVDSVFRDGQRLDFKSTKNNRYSNAYRLSGDRMEIGTVKLDDLLYIFNEDKRLTKVVAEADQKYRPDFSFILRHRFGEPDELRELINVKIHEWELGEIKISLTEYPERDMFAVTFASRWDQTEAYRINTNISDF